MPVIIKVAIVTVMLMIFQAVIEAIFDLFAMSGVEIFRFHNSILELFRVNDMITMVISYSVMGLLIRVIRK